MALRFKCINCRKDMVVNFLKRGETAQCRHCGAEMVVPETATETDEKPTISEPMSRSPVEGHSMAKKASQKIRETADRLELAMLSGLFKGTILLTPRDVLKTKCPLLCQTRAEFKIDLSKGARSLHSQTWTSQDNVCNLHVYEGGLKFPNACPVNLEMPSHYVVVEVSTRFEGFVSNSIFGSQKQVDRISNALSDRYWFAIPFSHRHDLNDRAVHIEAVQTDKPDNRGKVLLRNREYARRFGKLNNLECVKWLATRHLVMQVVGRLGLFLSIIVVGVSGIAIYSGLHGDWRATGPGVMIPGFVIGLVLLGASIYLFVKGRRGEPL